MLLREVYGTVLLRGMIDEMLTKIWQPESNFGVLCDALFASSCAFGKLP